MFFKSNKSRSMDGVQFIPLEQEDVLNEIDVNSKSKPILLFKHSTRCGISSMVLRRFKSIYKDYEQHFDCYYLDLLSFRTISNSIAERYNVVHQSPQLIVIKNGVAVAYASHYDILEINFERFV